PQPMYPMILGQYNSGGLSLVGGLLRARAYHTASGRPPPDYAGLELWSRWSHGSFGRASSTLEVLL
ncbi:hypothetical protein F53441_6908, partial [Fusarium austroafricanum]